MPQVDRDAASQIRSLPAVMSVPSLLIGDVLKQIVHVLLLLQCKSYMND